MREPKEGGWRGGTVGTGFVVLCCVYGIHGGFGRGTADSEVTVFEREEVRLAFHYGQSRSLSSAVCFGTCVPGLWEDKNAPGLGNGCQMEIVAAKLDHSTQGCHVILSRQS